LPASPCPKLDTGTSGVLDEAGAHTTAERGPAAAHPARVAVL